MEEEEEEEEITNRDRKRRRRRIDRDGGERNDRGRDGGRENYVNE